MRSLIYNFLQMKTKQASFVVAKAEELSYGRLANLINISFIISFNSSVRTIL